MRQARLALGPHAKSRSSCLPPEAMGGSHGGMLEDEAANHGENVEITTHFTRGRAYASPTFGKILKSFRVNRDNNLCHTKELTSPRALRQNDAQQPLPPSPPMSPRTPSGIFNHKFIRRMTMRSTTTTASSESRRQSFTEHRYWEGVGPHGLHCLHNPPEPFVDLVLVHGLNGGSYKTWRKKDERGFFWPGEWLPNDPEFQNVRVHTFGYPADWLAFRANNFNVTDFGSSLYGHLMSSPLLNRGDNLKTSIILVGHSMGGLVIKRACLAASRAKNPSNPNDLATRIKCLVFLGTPHHGSNSAERLDRILRSGANPLRPRDFVGDLRPESLSNQTINDEFRYIAEDYDLLSFWEARPSPGGLGYVVDKDSACIGGPKHEIILPLDGNHRDICKFESEDDPNYRILHDHLVKMVDNLIDISWEPEPDSLENLDVYLDCEESHDETLETTLEQTVPGTCQWIQSRKDFASWMDNKSNSQSVWLYWLHAPPGTGKSFMSASIIKTLQDQNRDVAYFFFVNGDKYHRNVAGLLRSIAFQMSQSQPLVSNAIRELQGAGVHWNEADEKLIWRKLFANCILKLPLTKMQYWVVDALDESVDSAKLWPLLKSMRPKFTVRIFLTSRTLADIRKNFQQTETTPSSKNSSGIRCTEDTIRPEDSHDDIRRLLQDKESEIPMAEDGDQENMVDQLVRKSEGSFLWTRTVLKELETAYCREDIDVILKEVPSDMVHHYHAIFRQIFETAGRKKLLVKAMLAWTVCGVRPLLKAEMQQAMLLDVGMDITNVQRTVEGLCGQVLTVNKQGAVQVAHATVKEFLLDKKNESEYSIRREQGNLRLACACLRYLTSPDMRLEGRLHILMPERESIVERVSKFADYAATAFSVHLVNSPADDEELFSLLVKFLQSPNVLCWMEFVAEKHKSLVHVKEAGTNLKRFMEKRSRSLPPFGPGVELVNSWSTDLLRLVSKFGRNILMAPSKLPLLAPPICPQNSAIHKQFAKRNPGFRVVGIAEDFWADAISYVEHFGPRPTAISLGQRYLAIGKESGEVRLYSNDTFEEFGDLMHGGRIVAMKFGNSGNMLVTSGPKEIKLWDLEPDSPCLVWTKTVNQACTAFLFADDDESLIAVSSSKLLFTFRTDDESSDESDEEECSSDGVKEIQLDSPSPDSSAATEGSVLTTSSISPDGKLVALVFENQPISIWSVSEGAHLGFCRRRGEMDREGQQDSIDRILFNPNPDLECIVVTYRHGGLALVDYNNLKEVQFVETEACALASCPDGHTLATGDTAGKIRLWDFEKLALLYVINYHSSPVRELRFSLDGLRLVDLRETHSVIWEPAALIRTCDEDDSTSASGVSVVGLRPPYEVADYEDPVEISCLCMHPSRPIAIVGKDNGSVDAYDLSTGCKLSTLFSIDEGRITKIAMHENGLLVCACSANKVSVSLVEDVSDDENDVRKAVGLKKTLFTVPDFGEPVMQIVIGSSGNELLIAGKHTTKLWCRTPDDASKFDLIDKSIDELIPRTTVHEVQPLQKGHQPHWKRLHRHNTLPLDGEADAHHTHVRLRTALVDPGTGYWILEYEGAKSMRQLLILEKVSTDSESNGMLSPPLSSPGSGGAEPSSFRILVHLKPYQIKMFLGLHNKQVIYLGPKLWVRTVDLHHLTPGAKPVKRKHFFVPHEYLGGNHHVDAVVGRGGEIIFPRRGELAIVQGGLV
ncbi:hypothetical protein B0H63DRAFT_542573 [Podospora didyma]|uniref:GPI inositol-deacylase n=1 Tax=Podospora didyma TaxID=330526 RepID=A0AAE0NUU6_9PEZI|nr:hypothetical protein B0H63DRAFT_542573 [Podospora didyma]